MPSAVFLAVVNVLEIDEQRIILLLYLLVLVHVSELNSWRSYIAERVYAKQMSTVFNIW